MPARLGVVGAGWWATFNHIPAAQAHPEAEVVALAEPDAERRAAVAARFGIPGHYASAEEMLVAERLDGVMIATPHVAHAEPARAALAAGAHALVEKPMVTTTAEARALVAAARAADRQVLVPCGWNFRPYTAAAAAWIAEGRIGAVRHVVCQMASALEDLMAGQPMRETDGHMYRPPASTWADPKRAGGYGWGQMSHSLAWVYRVADLTPARVYCASGPSPSGVDYYDAAAVTFEGGATMALSGASTVPKHRGFQMDMRIFGTEGMILFDVERERLALARNDGSDEDWPIPSGDGAYDGTLPVTRFVEICLGRDVANDADAENGARVVETLDALYRSAASGRPEAVA